MKRVFDIVVSLCALAAALPVLAIVALAVRIFLGSPIFFRQMRPGLHGRPFELVKFRTMSDRRDKAGALLPDKERLGRFGLLLRSTSLDEVPELWNVIKGEMSLVGPRPLLMEYLPLYSKEQARRHEVLPGITGWTQVNGRNNLSWPQKFALDVWYVDNRCFLLDLKIIRMTVLNVLLRKDIAESGHVSMSPFLGNSGEQ